MFKANFLYSSLLFSLSVIYCSLQSINEVRKQPYQKIAENNKGEFWVGLKKGKNSNDISFISQFENSKVKQITVQQDKDGLRQINLVQTNGTQKFINNQGNPDPKQNKETFIFKEMEQLVGDFIVLENTVQYPFVGQIKFETSFGRMFEVGQINKKYEEDPEKYLFNVNNCFLAGFFGQSDKVINRLGIILYKPIMKVRVNEFSMTNFRSYSEMETQHRETFPVCNTVNKSIIQQLSFLKKGGEKHNIQIGTIDGAELPKDFLANLMVQAKMPTLVVRENHFEWYTEPKETLKPIYFNTYSNVIENVWAELKKCTCTWVKQTWTEGRLANVPFTANINQNLIDGFNLEYKVTGFQNQSKVENQSYEIHSKNQNDDKNCKFEEASD